MTIIYAHNLIEIDKKIEYILKEKSHVLEDEPRMADGILQIKTNLQRYSSSESKTNSTYHKGNTISGKYKNEKRIIEANYNKIRKILGWKKISLGRY